MRNSRGVYMIRTILGLALLIAPGTALAGSDQTDFGIRTLGSASGPRAVATTGGRVDLDSVKRVGGRWGRVTSTLRSPAHNRRVGGVPNSYHLRGQAIDIARNPGVSHGEIAAAYRQAGFQLIESLDEGDHSHFAFAGAGAFAHEPRRSRNVSPMIYGSSLPTERAARVQPVGWKVVYAPRARTVRPAKLEVLLPATPEQAASVVRSANSAEVVLSSLGAAAANAATGPQLK